jgi:hypothetical protein
VLSIEQYREALGEDAKQMTDEQIDQFRIRLCAFVASLYEDGGQEKFMREIREAESAAEKAKEST